MREKISVAMATYNGEKYIKEQIESILCQLEPADEIIVSDDGSIDKTLEIINNISDSRIKVFNGPGKGVKQNFGFAIEKCSGAVIFLCDQDDVWEKDKIESVLNVFRNNCSCVCVLHDCAVYNSECNCRIIDSFFAIRSSRTGFLKNMIKNSYIGCCMAFKSDVKHKVLPIPQDIEMHDQWIGLVCEYIGENVILNRELIRYRRHSNNVSSLEHHSIKRMVLNRIIFLYRYSLRRLSLWKRK